MDNDNISKEELLEKISKLQAEVEFLKKSRDAASINEQRFENILNLSPNAVVEFDFNRNIIQSNEAAREIFGFSSKEDMQGQDVIELVASEDKEKILSVIQRTLEIREDVHLEGLLRRKDGEEFKADIVGGMIVGPQDQPISLVGIVQDITERKETELALQNTEQTYKEIFNKANDCIFIHDPETGMILDVNEQVYETYGYRPDEIKGKNVGYISEGVAPFSLDEAVSWVKKAVSSGPQFFEWHCKRKDGSLFWVEVNLKQAVLGGQACVLAIVRDITQRKHTEENLFFSEERYKLITENTSDLICTLNWKGQFTYLSPSFESLGWRVEDLVGKSAINMLPLEDKARMLPILTKYAKKALEGGINQVLETSTVEYLDYRFPDKDGNYRNLETTANVICNSKGEYEALLIASDVTDRKKNENEMKQALGELTLFKEAAVGRENVMIDLKKEINKLSVELGREEPYDVSFLKE